MTSSVPGFGASESTRDLQMRPVRWGRVRRRRMRQRRACRRGGREGTGQRAGEEGAKAPGSATEAGKGAGQRSGGGRGSARRRAVAGAKGKGGGGERGGARRLGVGSWEKARWERKRAFSGKLHPALRRAVRRRLASVGWRGGATPRSPLSCRREALPDRRTRRWCRWRGLRGTSHVLRRDGRRRRRVPCAAGSSTRTRTAAR